MASLDHELGWLLEDEVFSVDGAPYTWGDVLASAELRGSVAELVAATRQRLAWVERNTPSPDAVREAASRFRYGHGLLSAEELEAWLARWHLSVADWTEHLRRTLAADHPAHERQQVEGLYRAVAVDAICSGFLEHEAMRLATDAALAQDGAAAIATAAEVDREISARALDWTRLDAELLELTDPDAAREAALSVRVDGRPLAEVAADCGVPSERRQLYLEEAERERLTELLGANTGELVGPIERNGGFLLVQVHGRTRPSVEDPELRRRAQAYLVERANERAVEARVRWA